MSFRIPMNSRAGRPSNYKSNDPPQRGRTFFLGIGINAYEHWSNLNNAVGDVQAIAELLQQEFGLVPEDTTLLLNEEAGEDNIIHHLERLAYQVKAEDSLLIYYAGHGHLDEIKNGFWIPADGPRDRKNRWIRNSTLINDYVKTIKSLHTLLISDSCYSGALFASAARAGEERAQELMRLRSRWAICSGRGDQTVADGKPGERSPFTQAILDALGKTQQEYITAGWLLEQVSEQTRTNYDQLPDGGPLNGVGHERGQYVFQRKKLVERGRSQGTERQEAQLGSELAMYNCDRRGILDCFWEHFQQGEAAQVPQHIFFLQSDRDQLSETLVHRIATELYLDRENVKWQGFDDTPSRGIVFTEQTTKQQQKDKLRKVLLEVLAVPDDCPGDRLQDFLDYLQQKELPQYQGYTYLPYILFLTIPEKKWSQSREVLQTFFHHELQLNERGPWVPVFFIKVNIQAPRTPDKPQQGGFRSWFRSKTKGPLDTREALDQFCASLPTATLLPALRSIDEADLHDWSDQFRHELSQQERIAIVEKIIDKLDPSTTQWPMKDVSKHLTRVCEEIKNAAKHI